METLDSILKRRSIRRFTDQAIPQADLELILKAGFNAPSAHRLHPLDYIIISEKERLNGMSDLLTSCSKFLSVISTTFFPAMANLLTILMKFPFETMSAL